MSVILVGAGKMALAYFDVLHARGVPVIVIGRGVETAKKFTEQTGHPVEIGGVESWLSKAQGPIDRAIVTVDVERLEGCTLAILEAGAGSVLLEKPGAMNIAGLRRIEAAAGRRNANVSIAYNRRYYRVVEAVRDMIAEDGGVEMCHMEFGEDPVKMAASARPADVLRTTIHNHSCHVLDLGWHLAGEPAEMKSFHADSLPWHGVARFVGTGHTRQGALFTYRTNWLRPGRWRMEITTPRREFLFAPLERPVWRDLGSSEFQAVQPAAADDEKFKPGVSGLVDAFLNGARTEHLCSLDEQLRRAEMYRRVGNYEE